MGGTYWFGSWMKEYGVRDEETIRRALSNTAGVDSLLEAASDPGVATPTRSSSGAVIMGGKGIDLTGALGCRHIDCLRQEIDGLFRHIWHYFDRVTLPDQALAAVSSFKCESQVEALVGRLVPFVLVLQHLPPEDTESLVDFAPRAPSCRQHCEEHAEEAGIQQAIPNKSALAREIAETAVTEWAEGTSEGHLHVKFQLEHPAFEHTEWGHLCSEAESIPPGEPGIRQAIAESVVNRYLAELSADALAARRGSRALGATIPFYKRLLANPDPTQADVAFELALPVSNGLSIQSLLRVRREEAPAFERFRTAIRRAVTERATVSGRSDAQKLAAEINADVVGPELSKIRDRLEATTRMTNRNGVTGVLLGAATAMVGLLTPLHANPIGAALTVGGAITLAAQSLIKAKSDLLAVRKDVELSDMYFLWRAHGH